MSDLIYKTIALHLLAQMRQIVNIEEGDLTKYYLKADSIAVSACVQAELEIEDLEAALKS